MLHYQSKEARICNTINNGERVIAEVLLPSVQKEQVVRTLKYVWAEQQQEQIRVM